MRWWCFSFPVVLRRKVMMQTCGMCSLIYLTSGHVFLSLSLTVFVFIYKPTQISTNWGNSALQLWTRELFSGSIQLVFSRGTDNNLCCKAGLFILKKVVICVLSSLALLSWSLKICTVHVVNAYPIVTIIFIVVCQYDNQQILLGTYLIITKKTNPHVNPQR